MKIELSVVVDTELAVTGGAVEMSVVQIVVSRVITRVSVVFAFIVLIIV